VLVLFLISKNCKKEQTGFT